MLSKSQIFFVLVILHICVESCLTTTTTKPTRPMNTEYKTITVQPDTVTKPKTNLDFYERKPYRNCKRNESFCSSCNELTTCFKTDSGFVRETVQCSGGETCLWNECSSEQNPFCDGRADVEFKCTFPGLVPDPFDCQTYHFCVPLYDHPENETLEFIHYKRSCPDDPDGNHYWFHTSTLSCEIENYNNYGGFSQLRCGEQNMISYHPDNGNMFYVCDAVDGVLYPRIYKCPFGSSFDYYHFKCAS